MAAMLQSPVAGLAFRRSSASLRLSLARIHIHSTPASFSAADRLQMERRRLDEKDEEEAEKDRRRRAQQRLAGSQKQRHGVSYSRQDSSDSSFDTMMLFDLDMKPRGSATDSTRASSSTESSTDNSSRSSGGFWNKGSSWSWGSGDSGGGGNSCSGGGDCGGGGD